MAKQAIKKGAGTSASKRGTLSAFKQKTGLDKVQNADKPMSWLLMPRAFTEALKLPGLPQNTVITILGHSNVGKSTLITHACVAAQKQGLIPVIIDTENNFSFQYAQNMGFECEAVEEDVTTDVVDPETGEIVDVETKKMITRYEGNFLYYNNVILAEQFGDFDYGTGKTTANKRSTAVIEDVARCITTLLDAQDSGELNQGLVFIWDSVGSMISFKDYTSKSNNAMWAAGAMSVAFGDIVNNRIPASRKVSSPYNNTFIAVNKVWMDSMTNPVGPATMQTKGGKSLFYATRLQILLGGQLTSGIKRLTAVSKGVNYSFGIETRIRILKNHLDAPYNVTYEDKIIATDTGFISHDELESYKKTHISLILKKLNEANEGGEVINENDVEFIESEEE